MRKMLGKLADYYMIAANGACVNDIAAIVLCICSQCGICSQMTTVTSSLLQRFAVELASFVLLPIREPPDPAYLHTCLARKCSFCQRHYQSEVKLIT